MAAGLNPLPSNVPLVDSAGQPTSIFQQWWENVRAVLLSVPAIKAAAARAQTTADTGVSDAASAQSTADAGLAAASAAQSAADAAQSTANAAKAEADTAVQQDVGPSFAAPIASLSRAALPAYASQTISNPPTQAQVQAIDMQLVALTQAVAALITDLRGNGALTG